MTPAARSHRTRLLAAAMAVAAAWVVAPAARPRIYAITGGTVITAPGQRIEGATVVLRDGLVEAVGAKVAVPADAVAIDAKGSFVYPGFIDAGGWSPEADTGSAGAPASSPGERRRATPREPDAGPVYAVALVHPERRAADTLTAFSGDRKRDAASMRKLGIVAVLAVPAREYCGARAPWRFSRTTRRWPTSSSVTTSRSTRRSRPSRGERGTRRA